MQTEEGDIGIILSIPHGGLLDPESIPERSCQCNIDLETVFESSIEISPYIKKLFYQKMPYKKIPYLKRPPDEK